MIELKGAPKEIAVRALLQRGVARLGDNLTATAFDDLLRVINSEVPTEHLISDAAAAAVAGDRTGESRTRTEGVLQMFALALGPLSSSHAREETLHFLNALASLEMRQSWPEVWRGLVTQLKPEAAEAVRFFEPVCSVLEGKDQTVLDALPPEQRVALEVLAKFKPKPDGLSS